MKDDEYIRRLPEETQDQVIARVTKEQQERMRAKSLNNVSPFELDRNYHVHLDDGSQLQGRCDSIGDSWVRLTNARLRWSDWIIPSVIVSLASIVLTYEVQK